MKSMARFPRGEKSNRPYDVLTSTEPTLPLWRAAAFVGFYCVGATLNSFWFVKLIKGAYKVFFGGKSKKTA